MVDNLELNAGSGGATLAADDISSVWYQRVKLVDGTADSTTLIHAGGGAEANAMAVHLALTHTFPEFGTKGLRGVGADPTVYISTESHHAWVKIAHACGEFRGFIEQRDVETDQLELRDVFHVHFLYIHFVKHG